MVALVRSPLAVGIGSARSSSAFAFEEERRRRLDHRNAQVRKTVPCNAKPADTAKARSPGADEEGIWTPASAIGIQRLRAGVDPCNLAASPWPQMSKDTNNTSGTSSDFNGRASPFFNDYGILVEHAGCQFK